MIQCFEHSKPYNLPKTQEDMAGFPT